MNGIYVSLVLLIFIMLIGLIAYNDTRSTYIDWLEQTDWYYFAGAQRTMHGLRIRPTGRAINHTDTSNAQPDPPIALRSSYLRVTGDFEIYTRVAQIHNGVTLQFYGELPITYDEWRHERRSVRIELNPRNIRVRIWDGSAASSIDERSYVINVKDTADIRLVHHNDTFVINVDGASLGNIPDHAIFATQTVWFGADAQPGTDGWQLQALKVRTLNNGTAGLAEPLSLNGEANNTNTLRTLAAKNPRKLPIGAAIMVAPLLTDKQYNAIALNEFSIMTPEHSLKPQWIHPQRNVYLFEDADTLVEAAHNNSMSVHGHALVMSKATPEWMQKAPVDQRKQIMIDHISAVMGRYKGKITEWDVINEPLSDDTIDYASTQNGLRKQLWFDAMGEDYIDVALATARVADPDAKLYINEYGLERDGQRWDAMLALVKRLKERGVPIDGVGFEAHVYHAPADTIDPAVLRRHIRQLAELGIVSRISEIDVEGINPDFQAQQYADVLQVCLEEPSCTSYVTWGITDLYGSTTLSDRYPVKQGKNLLWDINYKPKPALQKIVSILSP